MAKSSLIILTTSEANAHRLKRDLTNDFDLIFTTSGAETLKTIQKKIPAAIVMDHSLEDYLTYRFIDKVRNNPVTRNLAFILVSRESSHTFVDQAVRSGVAHYIGIPYEPNILVEKIKMALRPGETFSKRSYFTLPSSIETQVVSYGRISYVSEEGIHFETRLKLNPDDQIQFVSSLAEGIEESSLSAIVIGTGTDVFYNYPFAVDARWADPAVAKKVKSWIFANRNLNSPKKSKILFISSDVEIEGKFADVLDKSHYSARFQNKLKDGMASFPFLRPACVVVDARAWTIESLTTQQKFLNLLDVPWILFGDRKGTELTAPKIPFESPNEPESIALAIKKVAPWKLPEPDRIYFSKNLEDSRLRIFFKGKVTELSEMGTTLFLEREVVPPCNFQLDLKVFSDKNIRNPYLRVWPPSRKLSLAETEGGKYTSAVSSHFLGINDEQSGAIRKWLRDEELKDQRKLIADITPKPKPKS